MSSHESLYAALGRMLVAFQSLEATLTQGITLILNNQLRTPAGQLAYAMVSELSFASASRLASLLPSFFTAERLAPKLPGGLERLNEELAYTSTQLAAGLKLANEVEQRRNQVVHSYWLISPGMVNDAETFTRMKTRVKAKSLSIQFKPETISEIDENTKRAREAQQLIGDALLNYKYIAEYEW